MGEPYTPGPWRAEKAVNGNWIEARPGGNPKSIARTFYNDVGSEAEDANARLIASAPDHAFIGWAMCVGAGRWEPLGDMSGEFCMNGIRHLTKLDEFGVPEMTDNMRAAILKARGAS